jgi:hypothetical protein
VLCVWCRWAQCFFFLQKCCFYKCSWDLGKKEESLAALVYVLLVMHAVIKAILKNEVSHRICIINLGSKALMSIVNLFILHGRFLKVYI